MQLASAVFHQGAEIPSYYTSEGENVSPELSWSDAPANTKSFVLVMHDPDAPRPGGFTHWSSTTFLRSPYTWKTRSQTKRAFRDWAFKARTTQAGLVISGRRRHQERTATSSASSPSTKCSSSPPALLTKR